jgi:hypothetical protein
MADETKPPALQKEIDVVQPSTSKPPAAAATPAAPAATSAGTLAETVTVVQQKPQSQQQAAQDEETRQRLRAAQQQATPPPPQQSVQQAAQAPAMPQAPPLPPAEPRPVAPPSGERAAATEAADKSGTDAFFRDARGGAAPGAGRGGSTAAGNEAQFESRFLAQPVAVAPDGKTRWRITERLVQQSRDGGATWQTQYTLDEGLVLVTGTAPSSSVCWFVGASGAIVATADGRTWRRVSFPYAVNLVGVTSSGASNATVLATDKRLFVTTDGGARWEVKRKFED